jgi:glycosyltransferase involved in cell wall biosynthesis
VTPRLCFVALRAYGLLTGRSDIRHQGGAERQQLLLARGVARLGYSVSFVTLDHGQPDGETVGEGVRVFKSYRLDSGVRGLRFLHPRLTALWAAMSRADADIYYQRGAEAETGLVAGWCRRRNRRFVFAAAHDDNFSRELELLRSVRERTLYRYGLRHADRILAQTSHQQELAREHYGLESAVVRNCWSPPVDAPVGSSHGPGVPGTALWVGRISPEKRPEWLVALASDLPGQRFEVVGHANVSSRLSARVEDQLRSLPNVTWHGFLPHDRLQEVYPRATVLVCTSESEGFPNVFLEAWGHGVATVSTVDPDGLITAHQLGGVASSYEGLRRLMGEVCAEPAAWRERGRRAAAYVRANHAPAAAAATLDRILRELLSGSSARR